MKPGDIMDALACLAADPGNVNGNPDFARGYEAGRQDLLDEIAEELAPIPDGCFMAVSDIRELLQAMMDEVGQ